METLRLLSLLALVVVGLAGCGGGEKVTGEPPAGAVTKTADQAAQETGRGRTRDAAGAGGDFRSGG